MIWGLARRLSWPFVGEVTRILLGVLLAVAAALEWGSPGAAIAAGGSAAIAGATSLQESPHGRLQLVVGVSLGMGAAVLVGTLSAPYGAVFVVVVTVWCFAAGLLWAISANAGLVAAAASVLLVTASADAPAGTALSSALLAVAAGLLQAGLVAAWPRQRWRDQRLALARAYRSVATQARELAVDKDAVFDPTPLIVLREAFTLTERQARRRPPACRGLYGLPERISMTLAALRSCAGTSAGGRTLTAAAAVLDAIGSPGRSARADAQSALADLEDGLQAMATAMPHDATARVAGLRLRGQLHEATRLHFTGSPTPAGPVEDLRRPGVTGSWRQFLAAVRANLCWESPVLRHAVRLAAAVALGTAFARATGMAHGSWIALTVLMVLRPETAHTYTRCVARVIGNIAGIAVATTVTVLWHPTGLTSAVLSVIFLAIAYAVSGISYVPLSAALAAAIVFLIDVTGVADTAVMGERVIATLIGGALAVAGHVALPDDALVRLKQRAGELLKTEIDYAATVIRAFAHQLGDPDEALSSTWRRAIRARSAFEAASGGVRGESAEVRHWLTKFRAALNAVTGACAALETHVGGVIPATLNREFVVAVDDYVDALKGEPPRPARPWAIDAAHLAEADQQLRDAVVLLGPRDGAQRVLVTEVGTITKSLLSVADNAEGSLAGSGADQ